MRRLLLSGLFTTVFLLVVVVGIGPGSEPRGEMRLPSPPVRFVRAAFAMPVPAHQALSFDRSLNLGKEFHCLALNVYWEARSESEEGQIAVASVTLNRVASKDFPNTVCDVVRQGAEQGRNRCQFSWYCDGKKDGPHNLTAWRQARDIAYRVMFLGIPDPTHGALWYHADYVKPSWVRSMTRTRKIGRHLYYVSG